MSYYEALAKLASSVEPEPSETSFFSSPDKNLDPKLFSNNSLKPALRKSILSTLFNYLSQFYKGVDSWTHAWLAGSGVSYQWRASRTPADLDCLIGIDYPRFRAQNPDYQGLSDKEIAAELNEALAELDKQTEDFMGAYELTFYVNVRSDITEIKPYAAYSLTDDEWTVEPSHETPVTDPSWDLKVQSESDYADKIISRYNEAAAGVRGASNPAARTNAEAALKQAVDQGAALFDDIHQGRKQAFSPEGQGYSDFYNYRWQAGKHAGTIPALRKLKDIKKGAQEMFETETYGVELPNANMLIRRAVINRKGNE